MGGDRGSVAGTSTATKQRGRELDLERLTEAGYVAGLDVSPDGRFIVYADTSGGLANIYVQPLEGGERTRVTHGTESAYAPKWSPAGDLVAYLQDVGGDENYQIYVISPQGGEPRNLTNRPGKLHQDFAWAWDGTRIAFVSNRDGQFDVYYVDVATATVHRVTDYPSRHHSPEFSPDGSMIAFASNRTDMRSNWDTFVTSLSDGSERKITRHEGEADEMSYYAHQRPRWSPDGRRVLVASSVQGNYDIMAIDVASLEQEWIADSRWDEHDARWSPDGSHVTYAVNEDGNLVLYVKNLADGNAWPVSPREGTVMASCWTPDGERIIYVHTSPTQASTIWLVPTGGGERSLLHSTLPSGIDPEQLVSPELVRYASFDGRQISAFLYRPQGTQGPVPTIVMPHGGPTGQSMNIWNAEVQYLVSRGYAVFEPNFRGSTGYGTEFQWLNRNDWGGGDLRDVVAGGDWLEANGIASRIGIAGGSYGGFMTMTAITKVPERWAAAVNICGIVNLATDYENAREDMRLFTERNIGTPQENPELYYDRSPINFIDRIQCPVLILHGERDPRVPLEQAEQVRNTLEAAGKPYEYKVYEHEGHGFTRKENQIDSMRRLADFFDRYLKSTA